MSGQDEARALLEAFAGYADAPLQGEPSSTSRPLRLGTVASGYTGSGAAAVIFDGETSAGAREYLPLGPVAALDRVVLMPVGSTYVIAGEVGGTLGARMGDAEALAIANLNKIINGDFRVNQRVAASGASLANGAYFIDRWRSGSASNAVTWTGDDIAGRVLTVPSGKVIQQIIERVNMPAGQYTVTHDGTAQVCMFNEGGSAPAKAAGPVTVTLDGSANVAVEFGAGTVSNVRVLPGTKAYPFIPRTIAAELLLCKRYYYRLAAGEISAYNPYWNVALSGGSQIVGQLHPVEMRAAPTTIRGDGTVSMLHSFTYYNYSAGAAASYWVRLNGSTERAVLALYNSSDNGGGSLPVGRTVGASNQIVQFDAEL